MGEQEQDFIKLRNTHRGHKRLQLVAMEPRLGYLTLTVNTEHDLAHIKSAAARWLVLEEYLFCLIFQMVSLGDEVHWWELKSSRLCSCISYCSFMCACFLLDDAE